MCAKLPRRDTARQETQPRGRFGAQDMSADEERHVQMLIDGISGGMDQAQDVFSGEHGVFPV